MEPLMSLKGYSVLEDSALSRTLLNKFYREQGYILADSQSSQTAQAKSAAVKKHEKTRAK